MKVENTKKPYPTFIFTQTVKSFTTIFVVSKSVPSNLLAVHSSFSKVYVIERKIFKILHFSYNLIAYLDRYKRRILRKPGL